MSSDKSTTDKSAKGLFVVEPPSEEEFEILVSFFATLLEIDKIKAADQNVQGDSNQEVLATGTVNS